MGRKKKVTAQEVLDYLQENNPSTIKTISSIFGCTKGTTRKRLKEIRADNSAMLAHNRDGIHLIESITEENKDAIWNTGDWLIGEVTGMARVGKNIKRPLIQVRRLKALTKEERKELKGMLYRVTRLIDFLEVDDEDDLFS